MLARFCVNMQLNNGLIKQPPVLYAIFRNPATINNIPAYEGQPMIDTLQQQVTAAGGVIQRDPGVIKKRNRANGASEEGSFLFVNNFSGDDQLEASAQTESWKDETFVVFDPFIAITKQALAETGTGTITITHSIPQPFFP